LKRGFNQYINDNIRETLKNAMRNQADTEAAATTEEQAPDVLAAAKAPEGPVILTGDEIEAFAIVKSILKDVCDVNRLFHRNSINYVSVLLDDNNRKRICRFWFKRSKKYITIPDENKKPVRYDILGLNDIYNYGELIKGSYGRYLSEVNFDVDDDEGEEEN